MAATKKIRVDRTYSTDNDTEDKGSVSLVEKARQLNTSRTINGVGFNGTANISFGTDSVSEGSTNKYYTDARARAALSASTGISYNSSTGAISCTITQYTDSNARGAVSFTAGSGAYNSSTGVFTIPTNTSQLTNGAGFVTSSGVTSLTAGSYLTGGTITSTGTIAVDATNLNTASKVVARDASGNFSAGTITAALSGNATTATTLQTARAIQGVNFDGSAAITVVTAGTGISVSGTAVTNTLSTSGGSIGGAIAVTGAITATGEITAYYSDDRLKKDVVAITDPINKLMQIRGVTFRPNQTALDLGITDKEEVGVIAQEIQAVLPQLVTPSAFEGYITVKYEKLTALLIEAVKAQQLQIDALKAEVSRVRGEL